MYRGDECVSLGWCFWHRSCYGCLLCGSRLVYQGVRVRELFDEQREEEGVMREGGSRRRKRAREVDKIPLCALCVVETEIDGLGEEGVVQKGLRRVERLDGGVTRKRYEEKERRKRRAAPDKVKRRLFEHLLGQIADR